MKIVWQIFLKDLRRFARPLALLALVFAAKFFLGWHLIVGAEPTQEGFERGEKLVDFFRVLELAGSFFLTLRLIGEDSVTATLVFWRTRPISGGRLMAAKVLWLGLMLGVMPLVISVPWWIGCGLNAGQFGLAVLDVIAMQAVVVAPAVLVAVLTDSLGRALLWTLVLGAVMGTCGLIWLLISDSSSDGMVGSRLAVAAIVALATTGTVFAQQYLRRRLSVSVGIAMGGLIFTMLCAIAWPWNFAEPTLTSSYGVSGRSFTSTSTAKAIEIRETPPLASAIRITVGKASATKWRGAPDLRRFSWGGMQIPLIAHGVPEGFQLLRGDARHLWQWADGSEHEQRDQRGYNSPWRRSERFLGVTETPPDDETESWFRERRSSGRSFIAQQVLKEGEFDVSGVLDVSLATIRHLQETPASYDFLGWFALVKPTLLFEIPLKAGRWRAEEGRGIRIIATKNAADRLPVVMVDARFESAWMRWLMGLFPNPFSRSRESTQYFPVDRIHGKIGHANVTDGRVPMVRIGSVDVALENLVVFMPRVMRAGTGVPQSNGSETTTLAVCTAPEVARFLLSTKVERYEFEVRGE